jgi:hypothetical protein
MQRVIGIGIVRKVVNSPSESIIKIVRNYSSIKPQRCTMAVVLNPHLPILNLQEKMFY